MTPRSKQHSCQEELRKVDLKATPARIGVLSALEETKRPLDVSSVQEYLKQHRIKADKVTVFRIMNSLTQKGLAIPIQLNEGKLRYEHVSNANHHHFICESCGAIEDIADCNIEALEKTLRIKKGLLVKRHSLEFFGLCRNCQK
jgi:Fur family ferric uptake transcriptional regulator